MKILAISGSLREASANTAILRAASNLASEKTNFTIYKGLGELPHFNPELDGKNPPLPVKEFRKALREADSVVVCTPEYAFAMPGVLKNAFDWIVPSGELSGKLVAVFSASPSSDGGREAHEALVKLLRVMEAKVVEKCSLRIPFAYKKLNEQGEVTDPEILKDLSSALDILISAI